LEEIKQAVWECGSDKSPGPDGFNFRFIKTFWDILKSDICKVLEEFHRFGSIPRGTNSSFITLIPKGVTQHSLNDYRPISLIGSLYKIIAKILSSRLRNVMPKLISDNQFAFIGGRNILDGVAIANEVIDDAKKNNKPCLLFKVDFEKAYDSVSWDFLLYMMNRIGFHEKWLGWMRRWLNSTHISILVNGSPTEEFKPSKGLRQGDPMAPFLFLIVAEGLNGLTRIAVHKKMLIPYKVGKDYIEISQL